MLVCRQCSIPFGIKAEVFARLGMLVHFVGTVCTLLILLGKIRIKLIVKEMKVNVYEKKQWMITTNYNSHDTTLLTLTTRH